MQAINAMLLGPSAALMRQSKVITWRDIRQTDSNPPWAQDDTKQSRYVTDHGALLSRDDRICIILGDAFR